MSSKTSPTMTKPNSPVASRSFVRRKGTATGHTVPSSFNQLNLRDLEILSKIGPFSTKNKDRSPNNGQNRFF